MIKGGKMLQVNRYGGGNNSTGTNDEHTHYTTHTKQQWRIHITS